VRRSYYLLCIRGRVAVCVCVCMCVCVWHSDVARSIMERGDLVPCDDVTCQGRIQGQEVTRACDVTRSMCVCSRGFVLQDDRCVG